LTRIFFEFIAGYGLGGSTVALFGRVGGGIYTKAADVGSDLVGKVLKDLKEDDPSNPGTIADNVGDNVGDIAGMGADLFGSLAESTCAALVVSSTSVKLVMTEDALYFPMMITAAGIFASFLSVLCVHLSTVTVENVQRVLKAQIGISTIFLTLLLIPCMHVLPDEFSFQRVGKTDLSVTKWQSYGCILFGLWSGMIIGFTTEFFTSNAYYPTLALANSCRQGPAPNIILGLALGYKSVIIPIICIVATIYYSFRVAGMYGIGLSALGMLGALPVALSIDGYGPISDNAGGVSEMSGLPAEIRDRTDALDAAGNTTAAVGKGFAIGSACLVGLALFGAFITRIQESSVDILEPVQFAGLLLGAMLPYAFSALTMQAVGDAAQEMIQFIVSDYKRTEEAKKKGEDATPDYAGCIGISTEASLKKMIAPGALVIISPLFVGFIFGPQATAGLLAGAIVSGVQIAISASNTGGAWDNAKKEVEKMRSALKREASKANVDPVAYAEELRDIPEDSTVPKHVEMRSWVNRFKEIREMHIAAVVGDTVGDPLKDTSGPAINILIKLSAITSLVFGSFIKEYHAVKNEDE
jgi:inorganic pyrophosphatase